MEKQKAIFLDRDGVINDNSQDYYVYQKERLRLTPDLGNQLKRLTDAGFLLLVISNQGGIAKGIYTIAMVEELHNHISALLKPFGVNIEEYFFCPHHDQIENCLCRKPGSLLIERAIARHNVDVANSWLVGDSEKDIVAATCCELRSIKIEGNTGITGAIDTILKEGQR